MKKELKKKIKYNISYLLFLCAGGSVEKLLTSNAWLKRYSFISRYLRKRGISYEQIFYYLSEKINKYNVHSVEWEQVKNQWVKWFDQVDDHAKMFIYQLMYFTGIFDSEITKKLVTYAKITKIPENRYWVTMDLGVMTFRYQDALYKNYFVERKELMEQISYESCIVPKKQQTTSNSCSQKICVIAYFLTSSELNSARRVTASIVNGLCKEGIDVCVININSFLTDKKSVLSVNSLQFDKDHSTNKDYGIIDTAKLINIFDENYTTRLQCGLDEIYRYNPDIILDLSDEYSPISVIYSRDYCTVYKPFRSMGTSLYFYKNIIGGGKETYRIQNEKYPFIDLNRVIEWNIPEYIPVKKKKIKKDQIVDNSDEFIIVTMGNNDFYIVRELADEMAILLQAEKKVTWLLVGRDAPKYLHEQYPDLFENKKIIEWGFESDLLALCENCDIALRPNMKGGSGGTAIAAKAGLPIVLTTYRCDPMRWLGDDYVYSATYHDCIIEIEKLIQDKKYYQCRQEVTTKKISSAEDCPQKWKELSSLLKMIKIDYDKDCGVRM